jgi:hypothetical protein
VSLALVSSCSRQGGAILFILLTQPSTAIRTPLTSCAPLEAIPSAENFRGPVYRKKNILRAFGGVQALSGDYGGKRTSSRLLMNVASAPLGEA